MQVFNTYREVSEYTSANRYAPIFVISFIFRNLKGNQVKQDKLLYSYIDEIKIQKEILKVRQVGNIVLAVSYSACVVHAKTMIHPNGGE